MMPMARESTAVAVNPGVRVRFRMANRTSRRNCSRLVSMSTLDDRNRQIDGVEIKSQRPTPNCQTGASKLRGERLNGQLLGSDFHPFAASSTLGVGGWQLGIDLFHVFRERLMPRG